MHRKALGIQLALDDFGAGYSSPSSLHLADISQHCRVLIEASVKVA